MELLDTSDSITPSSPIGVTEIKSSIKFELTIVGVLESRITSGEGVSVDVSVVEIDFSELFSVFFWVSFCFSINS